MLQSQDTALQRKLVHVHRYRSTNEQRGGIIAMLAGAEGPLDVKGCTVRSATIAKVLAQGTPKCCRTFAMGCA